MLAVAARRPQGGREQMRVAVCRAASRTDRITGCVVDWRGACCRGSVPRSYGRVLREARNKGFQPHREAHLPSNDINITWRKTITYYLVNSQSCCSRDYLAQRHAKA